MSGVMAKKKPEEDKKVPFNTRLRRKLLAALRKSANKNRRSITTEIEIACERYLEAGGLWTPPADEETEP